VRASGYGGRARVAAAGLAATAALLSAGVAGADDPGSLRRDADRLRSQNASLASQVDQALLDLFALDSKLGRAQERLRTLERRAAALERREAAARRQLEVARRNVAEADERLAARLRALYIEGGVNPLAVLLGAQSLEEAISTIEGFDDVASQDKDIVAQVQRARTAVRAAVRELDQRQAEVRVLVTAAKAAQAALARARGERTAYLESLRRELALNRDQIARLTDQAAAAESRSQQIGSSGGAGSGGAPPPPPPPPVPVQSGQSMTVSATGYCLRGTTATGIPVAWGVIAVDPRVIPLGTRMFVPGYGQGVAADTGAAVKGAVIDLWFPTCAQAIAWGRRTVTITLL
jgi:3D (Asp-Asp-Asp) domain-containing protein/peptidoglycan hydrolase CwlO-like protein